MKRQLKSNHKPICIFFIGESAFDEGGPLREFSILYFDAAARNIMQGISSSFTLLHDIKKLSNADFERFGLLIAPALIYGYPGPRNMQESLVRALLDLPIDDGNIEDIPDFEIQTKLQELLSCADDDTFQNVLNEFPKRYTMGVTAPFLHLPDDKDTVIQNIIHHCCMSSYLEETRSVQKGMSSLGVSLVLFFSVSQFFYRLSNHKNSHMVTCFISSTFIFAEKVALDSANCFNNNNNNINNNSNSILVI